MAQEGSTATEESSKSEKPICLIWGCKLDGKNPTYTFEVPEEWSFEEQVTLRTICLGENAKDEFNTVEIKPTKGCKDPTPVRIATLKLSVLPMVTLAGFELTPPVTFQLKSGLGPVYLAGQHVTVDVNWSGHEEDIMSSEQEEEMEESPGKPDKGPAAKPVAAAKKQEQSVQEPSLDHKT
ncbi:nucleoplasmin-like [Tiliqua scincoides]|uniref:nucleoplasmin-like n=1 Tax=Tiliqua scincoides TaxID=71010 RepID=UPI003461AD6D